MVQSFQIWRTKAIGDIAPLMNYAPIDFNYSFKKNQKFIYADPLNARFYSKFDRNLLGAEVFFL